MEVISTAIPDVKLIKPRIFHDERGYFFESFQTTRYQEMLGLEQEIVQINHSNSKKNVLRGLHYQLQQAQDKLVTVLRGTVLDVAVDIRIGSPTFGQWIGEILSDENHHQLFIPKGFAHGFVVLSDEADFMYACTDYYFPQGERGLYWNDPSLAINWSVSQPVLSPKDEVYPCLSDIPASELPKY